MRFVLQVTSPVSTLVCPLSDGILVKERGSGAVWGAPVGVHGAKGGYSFMGWSSSSKNTVVGFGGKATDKTQRVFSPQAAPTTKNQRALL